MLAAAIIVTIVAITVVWTTRSMPAREPATPAVAARLQTKVFQVDQMTCATCPITVRAAMAAVKGVVSVEVDFEAKTATVMFDPTGATVAQVAAASTNAGYPASPAS